MIRKSERNRLIKRLSKFKGSNDENFNSWKLKMDAFERVEIIFEALRLIYEKDHRTILSEIRQLPGKPFRIYSIRLKTNRNPIRN